MDNHTWELLLKDGRVIDIPPTAVETVKRRWEEHKPINLKSESIPWNDIAKFAKTGKTWGQQLLADGAAQAFKEPVLHEDGSIEFRWVRKDVSGHQWATHFSKIPSYRMLKNEDGLITMAFKLPVHLIDQSKTP